MPRLSLSLVPLMLAVAACGDKPDDTGEPPVVDTETQSTWYADADADGYGDPSSSAQAVEPPSGHVENDEDCDDADDAIHPGADEICDGIDNDCDGAVDDEDDAEDASIWYADTDGDGFGDINATTRACEPPSGYGSDSADCDDADSAIHPSATELCDGVDNNCDGETDEDAAVDASTWYSDADEDGWGDPDSTTLACEQPTGFLDDASDCDDGDPLVYPGASERCDGKDTDCDGQNVEHDVPAVYTSIQTALDHAKKGDAICVAAGSYNERIQFQGEDVLVEGLAGSAATILDGEGLGSVVTITNGESAVATLRGFTITGGFSEEGGAGVLVEGADATLEDLVISDNFCNPSRYSCWGTGLQLEDSESTARQLVIRDNVCHGSCRGVGLASISGDNHLEDIEISGNLARSDSYSLGTGINAYETELSITGLALRDNAMVAVEVGASSSAACMKTWYSVVEIRNAVFAGNTLEIPRQDGWGGCIDNSHTALSMENVTISGNHALAQTVYGVGLFHVGDHLSLDNVVVSFNTADAEQVLGTGITVVDTDASTTWDITYSDLWQNDMDWYSYSGISEPTGTDGNIAEDPLYLDVSSSSAAAWDLHLDTGSLLIDAGDPTILDADGSVSDMGAFGGPDGAWQE